MGPHTRSSFNFNLSSKHVEHILNQWWFLYVNTQKHLNLIQLNVDTGVETEYVFPEGMFVQEPQFVSRPNSTAEDDGVILAQGVDGTKHKGKMQTSVVSKWYLLIC